MCAQSICSEIFSCLKSVLVELLKTLVRLSLWETGQKMAEKGLGKCLKLAKANLGEK